MTQTFHTSDPHAAECLSRPALLLHLNVKGVSGEVEATGSILAIRRTSLGVLSQALLH